MSKRRNISGSQELSVSVFLFTVYSQVRLLQPTATGCIAQTTDLCFSYFWNLGSLRTKQQHIWFLVWAHFLVCLWLSSVFSHSSHDKNSNLFLSLQGHSSCYGARSMGPLSWYLLNLVHSKGLTSNHYHGDQGFCTWMGRAGGKDGHEQSKHSHHWYPLL